MEPTKKTFFQRVATFAGFGQKQAPAAPKPYVMNGTYNTLFTLSFDGEKNLGEAGPVIDYRVNYQLLRTRSWSMYLDSELAQTVIGKYKLWLIGKGLKLQSEPSASVLESEGITLDTKAFSKLVEARFKTFKRSRLSDYSRMKNIDKLAATAEVNAIVGGDVLVVLRYDGKRISVQLIDGAHIQSPAFGTEWFPQKLANGNEIINGIEQTKSGEHVRYYVRNKDLSFTIIDARSKDGGLVMAGLIYGLEYRLDNNRGLPLLAACIETIKQMDRYKTATLANAEEIAKVIYQIVHQIFSDGSGLFAGQTMQAAGHNATTGDVPTDSQGKAIADKVAASTNREAFNMPIGAELKPVTNKTPLYFKDFFTTNIDLVCATLQIPPDVAMSDYNANFSASRAALKDWEQVLDVKRDDFSFQYYQLIYNFWLEIQILESKIQAPGYLKARLQENDMVLEAYRTCRFVGAQVPHIDPEKEVRAERLKLGDAGGAIPLTTGEASTERIDGGDYEENVKQFEDELNDTKARGIVAPPKTPATAAPGDQP